jgi:hypothetical protein
MNRFIIEETPKACAQSLCDSHVVKMVLEEAQMLCTVHRLLDGKQTQRLSKSGSRLKSWVFEDGRETRFYKGCHYGHPCTVWAKETKGNYSFAYELFREMSKEYTYRYDKRHKSFDKLWKYLSNAPNNIDPSMEVTPFPLAMGAEPDCIDPDNPIQSYRDFYHTKVDRFDMKWTRRKEPEWWKGYNYVKA